MSSPTGLIQLEVSKFFDSVDRQIENVMDAESSSRMSAFLQQYIRDYPTLGDYIYEEIFSRSPQLTAKYTDHTLSRLRSGEGPGMSPEAREEYYNEKIIKPLLAERNISVKVCAAPELKKFRTSWRSHLKEKGYSFVGRSDGIASVRNTVFHLAFALNLDTDTVSRILTKCLLMQDFNPKDPVEAIYYWCLKHKVPYLQMQKEYMHYYSSTEINEDHAAKGLSPLPEGNTFYLTETLASIPKMQRPAFLEYLWRLKISADAGLHRKSPRQIYRECFSGFPEFVFTTPKAPRPEYASLQAMLDDLVAREEEAIRIARETGKPVPADSRKKDLTGEKRLSEEERREFLLKILEENRRNYYLANTRPLLPQVALKSLFQGIVYTEATVRKRIYGETGLSRNELLATMFLYYLADTVNDPPGKGSKAGNLDLFEEEASDWLFRCGMHSFYLRNPFELFLALCFLQDDPLAYFMASWEAARRTCE